MRTELQYNLQRARALATELRCTLDTLTEFEHDPAFEDVLDGAQCDVSDLESMLDDIPQDVIGEGSVKLEIEPYE